jgi:hypothetical protein
MRVSRRCRGFSLIEAAIAVSLLALACLAVTGVVSTSLRAEAAEQHRREARLVLDEESAGLRALPYFVQASAPGAGPRSLLGEVFPHASAALNTSAAEYRGTPEEAVFTSETTIEGREVLRTARLVRETDAGSASLSDGDLLGWAVWRSTQPPALVVIISLEVRDVGGLSLTRELVVHGLPPSLAVAGLPVRSAPSSAAS